MLDRAHDCHVDLDKIIHLAHLAVLDPLSRVLYKRDTYSYLKYRVNLRRWLALRSYVLVINSISANHIRHLPTSSNAKHLGRVRIIVSVGRGVVVELDVLIKGDEYIDILR